MIMNHLKNKSHHKIVILGAGFGGLGMAAQLKMAGINDFIVLEKGSDIGGVWRDNTYPGAACDVESHLYCYSFFLHLRVTNSYAGQAEFMRYMNELVDEFDLREHIVLNAEIAKANWDDKEKQWDFTLQNDTTFSGNYFIPAWGQLNIPNFPHIEGVELFKGTYFHSARWDHSVDLTNKKVGSIGAAASAVQYIPEIAPKVEHLTVFQRSANWVIPREKTAFSKVDIAEFINDPELFKASRQALYDIKEQNFFSLKQGSKAQEKAIQLAKDYLNTAVTDPKLREKLVPAYEYGCKRILITSDYYPTLQRSNVTVETEAIQAFYEDGIITKDGQKHPLDVVVFGTGFKSHAFHGDLEITGFNGASLSELWADGASAYLGIIVPNFPNMFLLYGPNTNLNHSSILLMLEAQQQYIIQAIEEMEQSNIAGIIVNQKIYEDFNEQLQEDLKTTAFSTSCSSWYKNSEGKIINNWSGSVRDYEAAVASFNIADFLQI